MGWHVNNGPTQMGTFHPASRFRARFYRPDVIRLLLEKGSVAVALKAEKLILLTDVPGILRDISNPESLIPALTASEAHELLASGVIGKGMIPKVEACLMALDGEVPRAHIIDGRAPHGLLTEVFTDRGIGTMITG